ncbi:MAG: hypothetical protein LBI01_04040 [Elusimicrobium sp.]|jgi:hypothetical protein|nr:hypothetical protein [Elusimicrobium sp.]
MRTFNKFLLFIIMPAFFAACSKTADTASSDASYNRAGSRQEADNALRNKVFAAYGGEGKFYAVYALATVVEGMDADGYYRVKFVNGPYSGEVRKTKDVILRTVSLRPQDIKKSQIVMYDTANPVNFKDSQLNQWQKAVVYDERQAADGRVMLEFPRDSNDFMATREAAFPSNIRLITQPAVSDPRQFLP